MQDDPRQAGTETTEETEITAEMIEAGVLELVSGVYIIESIVSREPEDLVRTIYLRMRISREGHRLHI